MSYMIAQNGRFASASNQNLSCSVEKITGPRSVRTGVGAVAGTKKEEPAGMHRRRALLCVIQFVFL